MSFIFSSAKAVLSEGGAKILIGLAIAINIICIILLFVYYFGGHGTWAPGVIYGMMLGSTLCLGGGLALQVSGISKIVSLASSITGKSGGTSTSNAEPQYYDEHQETVEKKDQ